MARYADPRLCPDCHRPLPTNPDSCPSCGLPLQHRLVPELFSTLQHADALLGDIRASAAAPVPAAAHPAAAHPAAATLPAYPTRAPAPPRRTGLRATSVPGVLLGLGALCLLVAAVTFLAVAWSWLGVGGRTAVLLGLTATAAGLGVVLDRRGLRVAAEALTTVALGLVVLDVAGAVTAGWLGDPSTRTVVGAMGLAVAVVAGALLASPSRLVAAQVAVPVGASLALVGIPEAAHEQVVSVAGFLLMTGLVLAGRPLRATQLRIVAAVLAAGWWLRLTELAVDSATADPTLSAFWLDGAGLGLLVASALLLVPAALVRDPSIRLLVVTGATMLLTLSVAVPVTDESPTVLGLAALAGLVAWSGITTLLPRSWAAAGAGPLAVAALPALGVVAGLGADVAGRVFGVGGPFTADLGVRLGPADPWAHPLLLVGLVAALLVAVGVVGRTVLLPAASAAGLVPLAALGTVASYDVPLGVAVGGLALMALGLAAGTVRVPLGPVGVTSGVLAVAAAAVALPSAGLTLAAAGAALGVAALLLSTRAAAAVVTAELLLPAALAGGLWTLGEVTGLDTTVRALPVLVAVGALALWRPRPVLESAAAAAGGLALVAAVAAAADVATSLAVHLTVAGALVTASSLVNPGRRLLAWPGGLLLAAATWVRLADLGVEAPEAYTMPTAVALVLVGLYRLWRDPQASTRVLAPGLALATVPSLLWVVVGDPISIRALLLGVACLALLLAGARLGWSTPVAVGGGVGALLVLRELVPYAQETPQWVLIGLAGTLLTVVGVTWERRLVELRRATAYLGRLR